jgi:hypothetical protein
VAERILPDPTVVRLGEALVLSTWHSNGGPEIV